MSKPSCSAAALILANRESDGELLRSLKAVEQPLHADLLAIRLIQCEHAWKEEELWA